MNYIAEMNAFYDWMELNPLSPSAVNLWYALMAIANRAGWPEDFSVAISTLTFRTKLSKQSVLRARNQLQQMGRITFKIRAGSQAAIYHLHPLCASIGPQSDTPSGTPYGTPSDTPSDTQPVPINKQNKTKQNKEYPPKSPQGGEEDLSGYGFSAAMEQGIREWFQYKRERRESYKPMGRQKFLSQLQNQLKAYPEQEILGEMTQSMANGWRGILWDRLKGKELKEEESRWKKLD